MGRSKSKSTEFIHNAKTRHRTFQKKKDAIIKQAYQLQTLCDVDVSIITFPPNIHEQLQPQPPQIWPPESSKFLSQIEAFQRQSPEEKMKRTTELQSYMDEKCKNLQEAIVKRRMKQSYPSNWNLNYNDLPEEKLLQIASDIDSKIQFIRGKLIANHGSQQTDYHQSHAATDFSNNIDNQLYLFDQPANLFDNDNDLTFDYAATDLPNLMITDGDDYGFETTGFNWIENNSKDNNLIDMKYGYDEQIGYYSGSVQQQSSTMTSTSPIMMQYQYPSNPMPAPHMDSTASMMQYEDPYTTPLLPPLPPIIQYQCPATPMTQKLDPMASSMMQYQDPTTRLPPLPPIIEYQCPAMPRNLERRAAVDEQKLIRRYELSDQF